MRVVPKTDVGDDPFFFWTEHLFAINSRPTGCNIVDSVLHTGDWLREEEDGMEELNFVFGDAIEWVEEGKGVVLWFITMVECLMFLSDKSEQDSTSIISIDDAVGTVRDIPFSIPHDS